MRKLVLVAAVVAAACMPLSHAAEPVEGCQVVNPLIPYCQYSSTGKGGFVAVGEWNVTVHWSGDCHDEVVHGENGWIRSSADGDNNVVEDLVGAWGGTVNDTGYCVEAEAFTPGSAVLVGHIGPIGQDDPPPLPLPSASPYAAQN